MNNIMSNVSNAGVTQQPFSPNETFISGEPITDDDTSLIRRQTENRLLNSQARIEYQLLKARIISNALEMNKFLEPDDQIGIQEYKLCTSVRYRKQFFAMEFKQLPTDDRRCNHALDLIFQGSDSSDHTSGRTTLVLMRDHHQFCWRLLHQAFSGPAGSSKVLVRLIMIWLQNGKIPLLA